MNKKYLKTIIAALSFIILFGVQANAQEFESDSWGNIILMEEEIGVIEVYYEYERDDCNCSTNMVTLYASGEKFLSADDMTSLQFLGEDVVVKNKQQHLCCQIQSGLYTKKANWSEDYEKEEQWEEYHELESAEHYMTPDSDTAVSTYKSGQPQINQDMSFLNGSWKSRDIDLFYDLKFNQSIGGLEIFNGDDELMHVLNPVDFCGSYDHVFSIILSEEGSCWYIDIIDELNIIVYRGKEQGLEEYFDIVKVSDDNPIDTSSSSGLEFDTQVCDFGTILQGSEAKFTFYYKNQGVEPINIESAESNCGCVIVMGELGEVAPASRGHITIKYDSGRLGPINKDVTVVTDSGSLVLKVIGRVE